LQLVAGVFAFGANTVARIAAIVVSVITAIAQLAFLDAYPFWSIIATAIIMLRALTMHGRDIAGRW
jgi:hypothetical protein